MHGEYMDRNSPGWGLDSDEIASVASQDLHDNRPNRWAGSQRTWRRMTVEERRLWRSMKLLQDQDLAIHLYNAFALKRRGRDAGTAQDLTVTLENGQREVWAPPKVWTAWPLNERHVPEQRLLLRGEDDRFTLRTMEQRMPSSELQEELAATILRLAGERFHRRRRPVLASTENGEGESDDEADQTSVSSGSPASEPSTDEAKSGNGCEHMAVDEVERVKAEETDDGNSRSIYQPRTRTTRRRAPKTYDSVMSANDELSCELIRPSVRHTLSQLDATLTILHNSRIATADYASDSSASDQELDSRSGPKRGRGRPRSSPQTGDMGSSSRPAVAAPRSRRGRPRKVHFPREGETREEMLMRVARESHRRLPAMSQGSDAAFEQWLREGDEQALLSREEAELGIKAGASPRERRIRRLGLRDWSDVVGAAALAGFSSEVIARTAKRCANLFGQGMVVRRLDEVPAAGGLAFQSMDYRPEKMQLSELDTDADADADDDNDDDDDDNDDDSGGKAATSSRRTPSRQRSLGPSRRSPSSPPRHGRGGASPYPSSPFVLRLKSPPPRSQSRSSAGVHLCPVACCERAATGFSRRQNLKRHMQLLHPEQQLAEEERDSEDEVLGAVHVDGFLKPIFPTRRGWREHLDRLGRERERERTAGPGPQGRETSPGDDGQSSSSS